MTRRARTVVGRWVTLGLLPLVLAASLYARPAFGAEPDAQTVSDSHIAWTLQVDPLTTLLGFVHFQLERKLGGHASIYVGPSLRLFSNPLAEPEDFVGYGGEAGVRYYPFGTAPRGWWLLGRGVLAHLRAEVDGEVETAAGGYVSALGGYTWIFGSHFVVSLGGGVQYLHYTIAGLGPTGVLPAAHTTIGFAF